VEGKCSLVTVDRILLNFILISFIINFVPQLHSRAFCSAVEFALERNMLLYYDSFSFRLNEYLDHADRAM
jgi:hypothetical protein